MFRLVVIAFLATVYGFYQLSWLPQPSQGWGVLAGAVGLLLARSFVCRRPICGRWANHLSALIIGIVLGFFWPFFLTDVRTLLAPEMLFEPIEVRGEVVGLTEVTVLDADSGFQRATFRLSLQQARRPNTESDAGSPGFDQAWSFFPPEIEVHWYGPDAMPRPGEIWSMWVKLKPAWGSRNPGAFDYEAWLLQQGIVARGYVRKEGRPERLTTDTTWRSQVAESLAPLLDRAEFGHIYRGLIYGDRSGLSGEDWTLLRETGTIHLMAISGLHIGLMAAIGYGVFAWLWSLAVRVRPYARLAFVPRPLFAALGALMLAGVYAMLAGWAIPTQRAWLMLAAGLAFLFLRRRFQPVSVLALAAFLVVWVAPSSILSQGFWLSFAAVGLIFALMRQPWARNAPKWQQLLLIQAVLTVGLMPLLAVFYQQWVPGSFVANLVAVPFVTLIGLPLLALATLLGTAWESGAVWVLSVSDALWQWLWTFLQWQQHLWQSSVTSPWALWQALGVYALGLALWHLYRRWQTSQTLGAGLVVSLVLAVVVFWPQSPGRPAPGEVTMTVLDVGQAQALVFETANEVVVYDTGAKWGARLDGTKLAISPYLQRQQRKKVGLLLVSHADQDHMGGTASLLAQWPVAEAFSGQPDRLNQRLNHPGAFTACDNDQAWWFSGVRFEVLAPGPDLPEPGNDNDASCVLRVQAGAHSVLVTGDVGKTMETALVDHGAALDSDVLVAGHHGSDTSSGRAFLQAVSPQTVVFSSGFANRYDFPKAEVVERVEASGARWRNTACEGALRFHLTIDGVVAEPGWRQQSKRWYHNACEDYPSISSFVSR